MEPEPDDIAEELARRQHEIEAASHAGHMAGAFIRALLEWLPSDQGDIAVESATHLCQVWMGLDD